VPSREDGEGRTPGSDEEITINSHSGFCCEVKPTENPTNRGSWKSGGPQQYGGAVNSIKTKAAVKHNITKTCQVQRFNKGATF